VVQNVAVIYYFLQFCASEVQAGLDWGDSSVLCVIAGSLNLLCSGGSWAGWKAQKGFTHMPTTLAFFSVASDSLHGLSFRHTKEL
jgi:hypothetical protein